MMNCISMKKKERENLFKDVKEEVVEKRKQVLIKVNLKFLSKRIRKIKIRNYLKTNQNEKLQVLNHNLKVKENKGRKICKLKKVMNHLIIICYKRNHKWILNQRIDDYHQKSYNKEVFLLINK